MMDFTTEFAHEVRKIMEEVNNPTPPKLDLFMPKQGADRSAALQRHIAVEQVMYDWYMVVNQSNYREVPKELIDLYEKACYTMLQIREMEKQIALGGR